MVESVIFYDNQVWAINAKMRFNILNLDYLQRSEGISRWDRVRNDIIMKRASAQQTVLEIEIRRLK
jgi:hypothetical protein